MFGVFGKKNARFRNKVVSKKTHIVYSFYSDKKIYNDCLRLHTHLFLLANIAQALKCDKKVGEVILGQHDGA